MSQSVDIEKEVEIDIEDQTIKAKKMINIVVDSVECSECGDSLNFELKSDSWGDLQIDVDPCDCVKGE